MAAIVVAAVSSSLGIAESPPVPLCVAASVWIIGTGTYAALPMIEIYTCNIDPIIDMP